MDNKDQAQVERVGIMPPRELFEDNGLFLYGDPALYELQIDNDVIDVQYPPEGGVLVFRKGDKLPSWGFPFREAIWAADVAKRAALNTLKFLTSSPMRYILPLFLLCPKRFQRKIIDSAIKHYADLTTNSFLRMGVSWKPQFFCPMAREIYRVGMEMAEDNVSFQQLAVTVAKVFEFDDAYRYIVQDLFELIDKTALFEHPGRELARVCHIGAERGPGHTDKFMMLAKLAPFVLRLRVIRDPLLRFFREVDLAKVIMDERDRYRSMIWGGYRFGGVPDPERASMRMMIDAEWQYQKGRVQNQATT